MASSLPLAELRKNYSKETLSEGSVEKDPILQFEAWFLEAMKSEVPEPNAMALGTVGANGRPSIRIVLLKSVDQSGFVFFTNYQSRKGHDLAAKPYACLNFLWLELERQIRIEGRVEKISAGESDTYFDSRPEGSKLGAWVSPQSRKISKDELENRLSEMTERFDGKDLTRPAHWGGYRLIPDCMEFWQGRPNRLHDRIQYEKVNGLWQICRLAP